MTIATHKTPQPTNQAAPFTAESAAEVFTDAVLETIATATWPDGSVLIDIDKKILRQRLANQIHDSALAMLAVPVPSDPNDPSDLDEHEQPACENCGRRATISLSFPGTTIILCSRCVLDEHQDQTVALAAGTGRVR